MEINDEKPLVAEIKDVEDMEQKYDEGNDLLKEENKDEEEEDDDDESSVFNELDIKPIPTFKELGFRDSYGNYSTASTDDVESVNIIEESSIEIGDGDDDGISYNQGYNNVGYNRDSYNSYENNVVVIDDNDIPTNNTPASIQVDMNTNLLEGDNIPKLNITNEEEMNENNYSIQQSHSIEQQTYQSQQTSYDDSNLQPGGDLDEQNISQMTIDESLVPMRNASNEIYKEVDARREEIRKANYEMQNQRRKSSYKKEGQSITRMERRESLYGMQQQMQYMQQMQQSSQSKAPPNPKRVSSYKGVSMKNNETNVAEAAITAINNKMMGSAQLQQKSQVNNNYVAQTMVTSAANTTSNPSYSNNYINNNEQQEVNGLRVDSPTLMYGLHFIPPMLRSQMVQNQELSIQNPNQNQSQIQNQNQNQNQIQNQNQNTYDIANHIVNVNSQMQMQSSLNKYPSPASSNNSNQSAKISKISSINSAGMVSNFNNNRRPSQASLGSNKSNRTPKFGENPADSPASVYSNPKNQLYQFKNGAGSSINNGSVNGSISGSPHSISNDQPMVQQQQQQQYMQPVQNVQNQKISPQMKQALQVQLMPEYQGQPTTPSQEYIELNNIPKSPAVELNSTYNPYDLRIKKPVLFSVKTLYDYEAVSFEEVSFKANYVLPILAVQEDGWWETEINEMNAKGTICRRRGLIPSNFVEVINE